jgi:hypothetical protein
MPFVTFRYQARDWDLLPRPSDRNRAEVPRPRWPKLQPKFRHKRPSGGSGAAHPTGIHFPDPEVVIRGGGLLFHESYRDLNHCQSALGRIELRR